MVMFDSDGEVDDIEHFPEHDEFKESAECRDCGRALPFAGEEDAA